MLTRATSALRRIQPWLSFAETTHNSYFDSHLLSLHALDATRSIAREGLEKGLSLYPVFSRGFAGGPVRKLVSPRAPRPGHPSIQESHPDLVAQWHPVLNTHPRTGTFVTPSQVTANSSFLASWVCSASKCGCPHVWVATVTSRTESYRCGCPFCRGLQTCTCKSLAAVHPNLASEWDHKKNRHLVTAGGVPLVPENCPPASHKNVHWRHTLGSVEHNWVQPPYRRTALGSGCPLCNPGGGENRTSSLAEDSPEVALQWHPTRNAPLTPQNVTRGSSRVVWWLCSATNCKEGHPHVWQARILNRAANGSGCPFCSGRKICACNSLTARHPDVAAEFSAANGFRAEAVHSGSDKKVLWDCKACGHRYSAHPLSRTRRKVPVGCPACRQKTKRQD